VAKLNSALFLKICHFAQFGKIYDKVPDIFILVFCQEFLRIFNLINQPLKKTTPKLCCFQFSAEPKDYQASSFKLANVKGRSAIHPALSSALSSALLLNSERRQNGSETILFQSLMRSILTRLILTSTIRGSIEQRSSEIANLMND
jgi:hypothetical protein